MKEEILFSEKQRFLQWYVILPLIFLNIYLLYGLYQQLVLNLPWGNNTGLLLFALIFLLFTIWFFSVTLNTVITHKGIKVHFFLLQRKSRFYPWEEVAYLEVKRYRPVSEFGGWGIKGAPSNMAYNVSGNIGLQLTFKNGKKLLIGTRKKEELEEIVFFLKKGRRARSKS